MKRAALVTLVCAVLSRFSDAAEVENIPIIVSEQSIATAHYCGLYCFLVCARCYNKEIPLEKLFTPRYLSGEQGSSIEDLVGLSVEHGLNANWYVDLTVVDIWILNRPVMLLVKNSPQSMTYNHWVVATGADLEYVDLFDPSAGSLRIHNSELMALWGGTSLLITPPSETRSCLCAWKLASNAVVVSIIIFVGAVVQLLIAVKVRKWLVIPAVAIISSSAFHALAPIGLANSAPKRLLVDRFYQNDKIKRIEVAEYVRAVASHQYFIIDVRLPYGFELGHIAGATNLPVNSSYFAIRKAMALIPHDKQILVYCQSATCEWAAYVAQNAVFADFPNVYVLEGGYEEYLRTIR